MEIKSLTKADLMHLIRALLKHNDKALRHVRKNISMNQRVKRAEIDIGMTYNTLRTIIQMESVTKEVRKRDKK